MTLSYIMTILFTLAAVFYCLVAMHLYLLEEKKQLHLVFLLLCAAMIIWSVSFAVVSGTPNVNTALLWHRISVFGYGISFSFLLHFALLLTGLDSLLKKSVTWLFLYMPPVLNIIVYSFGPSIGLYEYKILYTSTGWITSSAGSPFDMAFYAYVLTFSALTFGVMIRWRIKAPDNQVRKQFRLTVTSLGLTVIIGIATDMLITDLFGLATPAIAPLLVIIPTSTVIYATEKYGLLQVGIIPTSAVIMKSEMKSLMYKYMSLGFMIGGVVGFVSKFFLSQRNLLESAFFGITIFAIGIMLSLVMKYLKKEYLKDYFVLAIFCMVIPIITLSGYNNGSTTVWVIPLVLSLPFMAYSENRMLIGLAASAALTTIVYVNVYEDTFTIIDSRDYGLRFVLIGVSFVLAFLVNHVYRTRLEENHNQLKLQQMIAEVSTYLSAATFHDFDRHLQHVLEMMTATFQMNRGYYFLLDRDKGTLSCMKEWYSPGLQPKIDLLQDLPIADFPWWLTTLEKKGAISLTPSDDLVEASEHLKEILRGRNVHSTAAAAIRIGDHLEGFIGMDTASKPKAPVNEMIPALQIVGNIISETLAKIKAEKKIYNMAYYDQLTGLPSRQLFMDRLQQSMSLCRRTGKKALVALLDLDSFKTINDSLGHDKGDELLREVAIRLNLYLSDSHTICRFGGDEYLILCNDINDDSDAEKIGEQILSAFSEEFIIYDSSFIVTASIGIALYPDDGKTAEKLIKSADIAMYHAKDQGKNVFMLTNDRMKLRTNYLAELTNSLFKAMEKKELSMVYQPQVDLSTGKISGVESLIRWNHGKLGPIKPYEFIQIAERNGFILPLGNWIFEEVFKQVQQWQSTGCHDFTVAINVSFMQLKQLNFAKNLKKLLESYEINAEYIELEITETIAMTDKAEITATLEELQAMGISLAIDDFGTEYSSLGRLKNMTVDKIKIAKPFIDGIQDNTNDEAIIRSIIALAHNLGLKTIAEGVEDGYQLEYLIKEGCDWIQGYYFYQPMPAEALCQLLRDHSPVLPFNNTNPPN